MKKICVVILTILILFCSIALFPFNTYAAENDDNIDINIYLSGNPSTPLLSRSISTLNLNNWNGVNDFYLFLELKNYIYSSYVRTHVTPHLYYPNNNSQLGDISTYSQMYILSSEEVFTFNFEHEDTIEFVYDINNSQFYPWTTLVNQHGVTLNGFLINGNEDFNLSLCYNDVDNPLDNSIGEFVFNLKNYDTDDTYFSTLIYAKDITRFIGSSDWQINKILFGAKIFNFGQDNAINSQGLYFEVESETKTDYFYIVELSEYFLSFTEIYILTDRQWISLNDGIFDLESNGITLNSQSFYDFSIYVDQSYLDITDIYVNVYNYNATALYDSTIFRGTYLDYYIGFSFEKTTDGTITGNIFLNMYYSTNMVSMSWSFNLNSHDITDFKGINFKIGQSYIDIPYDGKEKDLTYYGKFLPTSDNNIFSIYLIQGAEVEEIRLENSVDFIKDSENKLSDFTNSMNELEDDKSQYKAEGGYRVNQAVNDLQSTMNTFYKTAPEVNSIFNQIYDNQVILVMLTTVLSVALISYVLYGKKA